MIIGSIKPAYWKLTIFPLETKGRREPFFHVTLPTLALIMWSNRRQGNLYMVNLVVKSCSRPIPAFLLLIALSAGNSALAQDVIEEADLVAEWRGVYNINIGGDRDIIFTVTHDED